MGSALDQPGIIKLPFFLGRGSSKQQIDGKFSRDIFSYLSAVLGGGGNIMTPGCFQK